MRALLKFSKVPLKTDDMSGCFISCCFFPPSCKSRPLAGLQVVRHMRVGSSPSSYLIHRQTCCRSQSRWESALSSRDWRLLSCDGTSPSPVWPTAGWRVLETVVPRGLSQHQNRRWGNTPSVGGPSQDSREQGPGEESVMAHTLPAQPG